MRFKLLALLLLTASLNLTAQTITKEFRNAPLSSVLKEIEAQTQLSVIYKTSELDGSKPITASFVDAPIDKVLNTVLSNNLEFKIENRLIVISERRTSSETVIPTINGIILDAQGLPVIGAAIFISGTNKGVVSDYNGAFSIEAKPGELLTVSCLGYDDVQVAASEGNMSITINESQQFLEEVVVVGYGLQKKANLSGSVASVDFSDAGEKRAITSLSAGLQGAAAGMLAQQSSGQPGADEASVTIRGWGTLNNSSPLVVVDGIVGNLSDVNPHDVASMSVLKDAASSAIYGSRAANGVILITTKAGSQGTSRVSYNGRYGVQRPAIPIEVVSDYPTYMRTINQAFLNSGNVAPFGEAIIQEWIEGSKNKSEIYANTDWFRTTFKLSSIQEHNIQATGGKNGINYLVSAGYLNNEGTMPNTGYQRYSFRSNVSADVTDWIKLSANLNGFHGIQDDVDVENVMVSLGNASPGILPKTSDGRFGGEWAPGGNVQSGNIFHVLSSYDRIRENTRLNGKLGIDFNISEKIKWYNSAAVNATFFSSSQMNYPGVYNWDLKNNVPLIKGGTTSNQLTEEYSRRYAIILDSFLVYDILKGSTNHDLSLTAGYNQEYNSFHNSYIQALDVLSAETPVLNAATTPSKISGSYTDSAVRSFFGRINYAYAGKYIFEANFRADGSSRFAKGNRWGYFPSFSAAWRISQEDFFKGAGQISDLKLRLSWGQLGNNSIGDYATQLLYSRTAYVFGEAAVTGAGIKEVVNSDIKWESTTMSNFGLDIAMLDNRFSMSIDAFNKLTNDILVRTKIPGVLGGLTAPFRNAGVVRNAGIEMESSWKDKIGGLDYNISLNYSYVKNKVLKYQGNVPSYSGQRILLEGYGIYDYYVREVECVATQDKIDSMLADGYVFYPSTPHPGDLIYKDQQKPGEQGYKIIDDNDRVVKGSSYPRHFFGANLSLAWKGFDLSVMLSGVAGVSQYLNSTWYTNVLKNGSLINKKFLNAWSYDNQDSKIPAITSDDGGRNTVSNDFWLQDASYLKLRNLTLGYSLPEKFAGDFISRLRFYLTGENLLTLTRFEGLDPETGSTSNYPNMTRYMFGVSITF